MATITERVDGRKYTRDANGTAAATRTFVVLNAANEHSARVAFEELADHRQFPGVPDIGLVLDRIDIEGRGGNSHYVVTATYSTFKGGRRQAEPSNVAFEPFFGWERVKAEVEVPWCWVETITTTSGDLQESTLVWAAGVRNITERRIRRTLTVEFVTDQTRELDIIAEQEDNLHIIRGNKYHFIGADVAQDTRDPKKFSITYTWEWDRGTYMPNDSSTTLIPNNAPLLATRDLMKKAHIPLPSRASIDETGGVLIRAPYYRLDLIANESASLSPTCIEWLPYYTDADGWRGLPGMIPL